MKDVIAAVLHVFSKSPQIWAGILLIAATGTFFYVDGRATDPSAPPPVVAAASTTSDPVEVQHSSTTSSMQEVAECPECGMVIPPAAPPEMITPTPTPEPTATPSPVPTEPPPPTPTPAVAPFDVPATSVAIIEAQCGALLYGKEPHTPVAPASLTKIITALAAIDHVNLGDIVTADISAKALKQQNRSSVMGLEPGMRVTVEDLLYGLFLPSGNDAAIMLAKHVSGSEEAFSALMNETAQRLGLANSTFDNPHGLDSPGLHSTAYDMAVAGMALMQNPTLAQVSSARSYTLGSGLQLRNGNRLLEHYPGAYGVKIGHTRAAKYTIVGAAEHDGRHLYIAVMGSEDLYGETGQLLDWAFTLPSACVPV
jgi:D-alanyl-D-alanine carboxypeptidase